MSIQYNPTKIYEQIAPQGQVCPIKQVNVAIVAGAAAADVVPLVSGKVIRILSLNVLAVTATVTFNLQSNAVVGFGDYAIFQQRNFWLSDKIGIFDSVVSLPVQAVAGAGSNVGISVKYIEFTP